MSIRSSSAFALLALTVASNVSARSEEARVEELFVGTSPFVQDKGETQLTFRTAIPFHSPTVGYELPFGVEYGITDRLQVELEASTPETEIEVGLLVALTGESSPWHLAAGFELPLFGEESEQTTGSLPLRLEPVVVLARTTHSMQLFGELALKNVDDPGGLTEAKGLVPEANAGVVLPARGFVATMELTWRGREGDAMESRLSLTPGATFKLGENIEAGAAVRIPFRDARSLAVLTNVVLEF